MKNKKTFCMLEKYLVLIGSVLILPLVFWRQQIGWSYGIVPPV